MKTLDHLVRASLLAWILGLTLLVLVRPVLALPVAHAAVRGASWLWVSGGLAFLACALLRCAGSETSGEQGRALRDRDEPGDLSLWLRDGSRR